MKKTICILLATLLLGLTACKQTEKPPVGGDNADAGNSEPQKTTTTTAPESLDNWGVVDGHTASNDSGMAQFFIHLPLNPGSQRGGALLAVQEDASVVIVDGENFLAPVEIDSLDTLFPTWFESPKASVADYMGMAGADYEFEVTDQEMVTIGEYEMCRYEGKHTYTYHKEPKESQWVAYATKLKTNGAYVYWMVLDYSEDQSMSDTIADHAQKIALTLEEG